MTQVPTRRRWLIVAGIVTAVVVSAVAIAGWVIIVQEPFKHEALSYETPENCPGGSIKAPPGKRFVSRWDGDALVVHASVCANCSARIEKVSAQVLGDVVLMRIGIKRTPIPAACNCEHLTTIRLSSLPKRDYKIIGGESLWPGPMFCE
jgi:hypothetical protein